MDALALLCNLYGDGPATLKRLRVNGVLRIEDLNDKPSGELATLLALPTATARRFMKEAAVLRKRVLNSVESAEPAPSASAVERTPHVVTRGKRAILEAASRRWEELERTPIVEPARAAAAPVAKAPTTPLAAAQFDRATQGALEEAGVSTLEELIAADSDALAQASNLGISQILFAQGLARRMTRESSARSEAFAVAVESEQLVEHVLVPPPRTDARFSPSERPPAECSSAESKRVAAGKPGSDDETAGPFA